MKYPGSGGAHTRGQIIGGACWDLRTKSGMSSNLVNALAYESITNMLFEETFGDFMDEMFSADDDDANIFNGTPHDDQLFDAFINDHAIIGSYLAGTIKTDVTIYHDVELIDNVIIESGKTLTIASGKSVTLNGYYLKCTGSGKIIKNGIVSGYTSYAQSGSDYKGLFPASTTIQQILSWHHLGGT
jgi:hypothetical protein